MIYTNRTQNLIQIVGQIAICPYGQVVNLYHFYSCFGITLLNIRLSSGIGHYHPRNQIQYNRHPKAYRHCQRNGQQKQQSQRQHIPLKIFSNTTKHPCQNTVLVRTVQFDEFCHKTPITKLLTNFWIIYFNIRQFF